MVDIFNWSYDSQGLILVARKQRLAYTSLEVRLSIELPQEKEMKKVVRFSQTGKRMCHDRFAQTKFNSQTV